MTEKKFPILGIDIGATSVKFGKLENAATLSARGSEPIRAESNAQFVEQLASIVARPEFADCRFVGIGSPGPLDAQVGMIIESANMPQVKNCALVSELQNYFPQKKIRLENDANAAALGEFFFGHGKNLNNLAVLTLGTGVGGGCIFNGRLERGYKSNFFEVGHIPVAALPSGNSFARRCGCGAMGCLESYASATGISGSYFLATGQRCSAAEIAEKAQHQDKAALEAYQLAGAALGIACATITQIMNITDFIFTGGVAAAESLLRSAVMQAWRKQALAVFHDRLNMIFTRGDENAGILGAAALFLEQP